MFNFLSCCASRRPEVTDESMFEKVYIAFGAEEEKLSLKSIKDLQNFHYMIDKKENQGTLSFKQLRQVFEQEGLDFKRVKRILNNRFFMIMTAKSSP